MMCQEMVVGGCGRRRIHELNEDERGWSETGHALWLPERGLAHAWWFWLGKARALARVGDNFNQDRLTRASKRDTVDI